MFFYVSKILLFLIQPLNWILFFFIFALATRNKKWKRYSYTLGLVFLVFFTNPYIINSLLNRWEGNRKSYEELGHYEVAIVLGGYSNTNAKPRDRVHFVKGADRLLHAMELYKMGKVDKILISGGSAMIIGEKISESISVIPFMKNLGIPEKDIIIEAQSKNTHQNAKYSAVILKKEAPYGRCLLITSAFHMKRASGCFDKQGIVHTSFPTDYYGSEFIWSPSMVILPKINSFLLWHYLIKEWVGIAAYKMAGYI